MQKLRQQERMEKLNFFFASIQRRNNESERKKMKKGNANSDSDEKYELGREQKIVFV